MFNKPILPTSKWATTSLFELAKRVPPNQVKQFEEFRKKSVKYLRKVNKYPDKLPTIDWEYYRQHVRNDYIKLVDEFQIRYEQLDNYFAKRHEILDHSKYFIELDQLTIKAQAETAKFIKESKDRVKIYKEELKRLKKLQYDNMTMEEFIELREDIAQYVPCQGKPLYWPHTPEEQLERLDNNTDKEAARVKILAEHRKEP